MPPAARYRQCGGADWKPLVPPRGGDVSIGGIPADEVVERRSAAVKIQEQHLELASSAWRAYGAPTPRDWFDLLSMDLSPLPLLRSAAVALLEELPRSRTGLGATEMRMLEQVAQGDAGPFDVFPGHEKPNTRRTFDYWQIGALLDGLAQALVPAVTGLEGGPFTTETQDDRDRHRRYQHSMLSLTPLGQAVPAGHDDFTRYNCDPSLVGRDGIDR